MLIGTIATLLGGCSVVSRWVRRGLAGKLRQTADSIGPQYMPRKMHGWEQFIVDGPDDPNTKQYDPESRQHDIFKTEPWPDGKERTTIISISTEKNARNSLGSLSK